MRKISIGDRIAMALLISMAGCRHTSVQDDPNWPSPGPVDVASLPPIHSVINHGTTDPDTLLAGRASVEPGVPSGRTGSTAAPIVLGPVSHSNSADMTASNSAAPASEPAAPTPASIEAIVPPAPPAATTPVASVEAPGLPPLETASSAPPTAAGTQPDSRDEAVRPVNNPNESPTLPPQLPESANLPQSSVSSTASNLPPAQAPPASPSFDTKKEPATGISGTPPKEIDFEGLPATAVSAGRVAAKVGTDVITVYDLNIAIQEWIKNNVPSGQSIPRREGLMIAKMVLGQMVDRILIIQEAHRLMKSEKQKEALLKQIDQVWQEQQIPPLLKKYKVDTPYELDQALKKQGRSLEAARKEFMDDAVAHEFMGMKLGGKVYVSLVDMRKHYNEHRQEFDRPAQLTWREIRIPIEPGSEAAARQKATELLEQIRTHSDFATLAKRHGKGPTADQGGLWETSPGAFAVPEINAALEKLKPGQVSGIIEASRALFIVKLESHREAGPARFDEVQSEIRKKIFDEKLSKAASAYLQELRKSTVVYSIFDDIPDPRAAMTKDAQLQRTANQSMPSAQRNPSIPPGLPSPQTAASPQSGSSMPAPGGTGSTTDRLPNLNPAGALPPPGTMSGPPVSPL